MLRVLIHNSPTVDYSIWGRNLSYTHNTVTVFVKQETVLLLANAFKFHEEKPTIVT